MKGIAGINIDGPHCKISNRFTARVLGGRVVERVDWPQRSPDFSSPNFLLWGSGICQGKFYSNDAVSLEEVKQY
jgi:hypothetical protein